MKNKKVCKYCHYKEIDKGLQICREVVKQFGIDGIDSDTYEIGIHGLSIVDDFGCPYWTEKYEECK
jgi:hypothetical protein